MSENIYEKLQEQVDQYSVGFPKTESGVEMKILRKLFTEEEARMYLHLSMMLETPETVAQRIKQDPESVSRLLSKMGDKGIVFRVKKEGLVKYAAVPFVVGFYEFQLKNLDKELAAMVDQYLEEAFGAEMARQTVPMRTIAPFRCHGLSPPMKTCVKSSKGKKRSRWQTAYAGPKSA